MNVPAQKRFPRFNGICVSPRRVKPAAAASSQKRSGDTNRITPAHVDAAASALELERPRVAVRTWLRQRFAAFAAGMTVAGLLTAGGATLWHYREFAAVMVQLVASRP